MRFRIFRGFYRFRHQPGPLHGEGTVGRVGGKRKITGEIMAKDGIMIDEIAYLVLGGKRCFFFFVRRRDSFKDLKGIEA